MKKLLLNILLVVSCMAVAQTAKGPKIGYFDMMHILKSVPEYAEANNQLELRVQDWKKEIEKQQNHIALLTEELNAERVLLTKELIEEKENEIELLKQELSEYQHKKFGPNGDLFTQKIVLVKPIQDQVFTIVNEIAERRKYDFVYDMSSASNGLVFANQRFDMNEEIINALNRAAKREQHRKKRMSKEEEQAEDDKKYDPDARLKEEARQEKIQARKQKQQEARDKKNKSKAQTEELDQEEQELDDSEDNDKEVEDKPKKLTKEERQALIEARKKEIQLKREEQMRKKAEALEKRKQQKLNKNNQNQTETEQSENN
ncbi:MAG: OmpH family outer membrane protein [Bacteroidota bacterium]|nr:OmpH family outer membrane protein [Bacteroidota bacterium]